MIQLKMCDEMNSIFSAIDFDKSIKNVDFVL